MKKIIKDPKSGRVRVQTIIDPKTMTQESRQDETDVNKIIAKYKKTQDPSLLAGRTGVYADLTEVKDYQTSLTSIQRAKDSFLALPSVIRNRFQNDPSQLISFLADPKNRDESIRLGLRIKPKDWVDPNDAIQGDDKKP